MITLTDKAAQQIKRLREEQNEANKPLRLYVEAGGCSGMQYGMTFDTARADDEIVRHDGVEVAIDPVSAGYLRGSVVDYQDGLQGSGFQIRNPNVKSSCGCGKSFQ